MLPINAPILPLIMYEEYNFPLTVHVIPPPNCQHLVHKTAVALANEASSRANNSQARMYCYNTMVMNNWNNQQFQEILNHTLLYMALEVERRNYSSTDMAMKDCVNKYLTLYTSMLVLTVDAVRDVSDSRVIDASTQNSEFFVNLKLELQDLQNRMYQQQMPQAMQQVQVFYNQQGQPVDSYGRPIQMPMHQGHPQQMPMQPMHGYPQQMPAQPYPQQMPVQNYPQQMPMQQQYQNNNSGFMHQSGRQQMDTMAAGSPKNEIVIDRFGKSQSQKQYFEEPVQQQVQQVNPPRSSELSKEAKKEIEDLVMRKGSEMDRAKHTITFMGKQYSMNSVVRTDNFKEQAEVISKASAIAEEDAGIVDSGNTILDINESAVVLRGQSKHIEIGQDKIFRCFGIVSNTVVSKDIMDDYVETLRESKDLQELVGKMTALASAFEKSSVEWNAPNCHDSKIVVMSTIDNKLTKLINSFVQNNMQLQKVSITSFVEDYSDLESFILTKYGPMLSLELKNFGQKILQIVFGTDYDELATEARNVLNMPDEISCVFLPENYSMTYLPMTDKELDYNFEDRLWSVSHAKTPILAKVLDSLTLHKKQSQRICLHDLVVTQDGVIYRLYENAVAKGYLIRKD